MQTWQNILQLAQTQPPTPHTHKINKSLSEWQQCLTPEQFYVTRQAGTERPFSSELCSYFAPGIYQCVCCHHDLFTAEQKYDSGSGWPAFTQPMHTQAVSYRLDHSHGMDRVEVLCSRCDAHLGHVFPDGPEPAGLRYCINAIALNKKASD